MRICSERGARRTTAKQNAAHWLVLLAISACASESPISPQPRLSRTSLLVFHDRHGKVEPVKTKSDWQKRRAEVLNGMQEVMGPLPGKGKRCALDVKVEEEVDCGAYL